jgi:hypothetical protein
MLTSFISDIIYLIYFLEYLLLFIYILYNLVKNTLMRQKYLTFRLFCYTSLLICTLRLVLIPLSYLQLYMLYLLILYIIVHAVGFTSISIIAACWYFLNRRYKSIKYDYTLSPISYSRIAKRIRLKVILANIIVYLLGIITILLLLLDSSSYLRDSTVYLLIINSIISDIIVCSYLFISGVMLLKRVRDYNTVQPKKLVCSIYVILVQVVFLIPLLAMFWWVFLEYGYEDNPELL